MKIAILSFYGRPKRFISSNRIYGLIRGLSKLGSKIYFFTAPTSLPPAECFDVFPLCEDVVEFSAFPIPLHLYEIGRRIIQRVILRNLLFNSVDKNAKECNRFVSIVQNFWNWRYTSPIFRDNTQTSGYFILKGVTERRLFRYFQENNLYLLFTSHAPPMAHEFGLYLKRRLGPRLFWIADFRDPIIDRYFLSSHSSKLVKLQKEILVFADLISMVSHSMIQDAVAFAQEEGIAVEENKFFCLYNGFFEMPELVGSLERKASDTKLRISYTGTIFPGKRDLAILFDAFCGLSEKELGAFEFIYAGPQVDIVGNLVSKYRLQSVCRIAGMVTKEEALQIQKRSDILLLLKSDTDRGVFTGKFFEYLFSGNPILVIGDKDEEFNEVARRVGGVRIVPNGPEGSRQIREILRILLTASGSWEAIETEFGKRKIEEVNKFHWDFLSMRLYERLVQELSVHSMA